MGSLYRRGKIWWLQVYQAGRAARESTGTEDKAEARRVLRERERQIDAGERPATTKATWQDAADDLMAYYRAYGTRNPREAGHRLADLDRQFQGFKLADIDAVAVTGYVVKRKGMGMANGTINIELATLRRALRLAQEHGKLAKVPVIKMLKPNAPRSGFFEPEQFQAVSAALPADLALVALIGYIFGWRLKSEVLILSKRQVDFEAGTLRLVPGNTKNGEG